MLISGAFDAELLKEATLRFLSFYSALSAESEDPTRWRPKPKFHMLQELVEFSAVEAGNPRDFWCYMDEDFVGIISAVAMSRGGAEGPGTLPTRVVDRVRALLAE